MNSNRYFNFNLVLVSLLSILSLIYLIYISDKGLDFTDEIYNLQGFLYPEEIKYHQTFFGLVVVKFIPFLKYNLINIRYLRIVLSILAAFYLAYSSFKYLVNSDKIFKNKEFYFLFLFLFIANAMTYSTGYQILSYNTLSSFLIQILLGVFFTIRYSIINRNINYAIFFLYTFFIGILTLALFLTKFSAAITVFLPIIFLIIISIYNYNRSYKFVLYLFILLSSFFVSLIVFSGVVFSGVNGFFNWLNDFMLLLNNLEGRSFSYLFSRYWDSIKDFYSEFLVKYAILILVFVSAIYYINRFFAAKMKLFSYTVICVFFIVFLLSSNLVYSGSKFEGTQSFWLIGLILYLTVVFFLKKNEISRGKIIDTITFVFILSIPVLASLGTSNWLTYQINIYPVFWFLFIYIFYQLNKTRYSLEPLISLVILVSVFQMFYGSYIYPYRINGGLKNQTKQITSKTDNSVLYINDENKRTIDSLNFFLSKTNFKSGDPMFSYFHQAGILYCIGAKNITYSLCSDYGVSNSNCFFINKYSEINDFDNAFVLLPKQKNDSIATINCLKNKGIDIENMILLGEIPYSIYDQQIPLEIYSPKSRIKK